MRKTFIFSLFALLCVNVFAQSNITLTTNDGWGIAATFFRGESERCVILLHDLEKSRAEFATLTEKLQNNDFCYLSIDLRGHGFSTNKGKYEEFEKTGQKNEFNSMVEDVYSAINYLKNKGFDEGNIYESFGEAYNTYLTKYGERIYKGEGSIDFICYSPLAYSPKDKKYLSDYPEWEYVNRSQWAAASGLPEDNRFINKDEKIEKYNLIYATSVEDGEGYFYTYNAGD